MKRVGLAGLGTENCTFSPFSTRLADFSVKRGREILAAVRQVVGADCLISAADDRSELVDYDLWRQGPVGDRQ
jgi:microcystin degradation protein MlrC